MNDTEALKALVAACEKEFCSPATEGGELVSADDESVMVPGECAITFGKIRAARAALERMLASQGGPVAENQECLEIAAKKLRRLRLTSVGGRKENSCVTVKSALQDGLGGLYSDDAVLYILEAGIRYYNEAKSK